MLDVPAIGVDIGGTKIASALVGPGGQVIQLLSADTPPREAAPADVEEVVVQVVSRLARSDAASAAVSPVPVGIGAAGFIDADGKIVRFSPHVNWREEPLADRLSERLATPVFLDNDANAAAWAEHQFGAARGQSRLVFVALGTGIGGALVYDGRIERGAHGMAGEFGHINVVPRGRPCPCGNRGCWERYCSGTALVAEAAEMMASSTGSSDRLRAACADDASTLTGRAVAELARDGDPGAAAVVDTIGTWLGRGLSALVAVLDPGDVVIGGGLSALGETLLQPARIEMRASLPGGAHRPEPSVRAARLGALAGVIGAADLARRAFTTTPGIGATTTAEPPIRTGPT